MLDSGDAFPALEIAKVGGGMISLPGDLKGGWGGVLLYRGHWCPYCKQQLTALSRAGK
ncbi:MAG: redoxin domain-containing protein, partial [Candidatus Tectomicrobia bacterium]|nr:redoxin domain-containing protein [Candidatus Tectomicrobia bacterium]